MHDSIDREIVGLAIEGTQSIRRLPAVPYLRHLEHVSTSSRNLISFLCREEIYFAELCSGLPWQTNDETRTISVRDNEISVYALGKHSAARVQWLREGFADSFYFRNVNYQILAIVVKLKLKLCWTIRISCAVTEAQKLFVVAVNYQPYVIGRVWRPNVERNKRMHFQLAIIRI